ncbi:hypothetical protein LI90_614 [Carbonactinospora thermoautotrophica]|uniref:Uncharacterized protein n=1 Tax=Carbonactinospora thermoautotrophica TaxID=1469144 RepID=A0A132MM95_9ACTN|nr:hypothetical protein [Carbonactinospora thermoautotrophica]KWW98984.1 hypothetical protein LI90_614 [Carbonactinospora thermoautotrophica]
MGAFTYVFDVVSGQRVPDTPPEDGKCSRCFGWGLLWVETETGREPGPDCTACHGTGWAW